MNDFKKFAAARDQLYHLKVALATIEREQMPKHVAPEAARCVSILIHVIEQACEAFMAGDVLSVSVDRYTPLALPGFNPPTMMERLNGTPPEADEDEDDAETGNIVYHDIDDTGSY